MSRRRRGPRDGLHGLAFLDLDGNVDADRLAARQAPQDGHLASVVVAEIDLDVVRAAVPDHARVRLALADDDRLVGQKR